MKLPIAILGLLVALPVVAQDIPTDQELLAAYCAGVTLERSIPKGEALNCGADQLCIQFYAAFQEGQQKSADLHKRLRRYLAAKGFEGGQRGAPAQSAALTAVKSGRLDAVTCGEADKSAVFAECFPLKGTAWEECFYKNGPPSCAAARRCENLSGLPLF